MSVEEQTTIEVSVTTDLLRAYNVSLENNLREMHDFSCHIIRFFFRGLTVSVVVFHILLPVLRSVG